MTDAETLQPRPMALVQHPPFVARRKDLEWLESQLGAAVAGRPCVALISGDTGAGKTRLVREFAFIARGARALVCVGRCHQNLSFPYLPFAEALQALLAQSPEHAVAKLGEDARAVEALVTRGNSSPDASSVMGDAGQGERARMFLAISRAVVDLARSRPVVLVLEDLHWSDKASLDLLDHLTFAVSDAAMGELVQLMIICTYRRNDVDGHLKRVLAHVQREEICGARELQGLDEEETRQFLRGLGFDRLPNHVLASIGTVTAGNPLFIESVAAQIAERGTQSIAELQLPEDVTAAVLERISVLSSACRRVLTVASFLGDPVDPSMLRDVCDLTDAELEASLVEASQKRLIVRDAGLVTFAHPSMRHVLYGLPSEAERRRLHAHIALTLERLWRSTTEEHVLELAHHLVCAGPAAPPALTIEHASRAGDRAVQMLAWSEAVRYYEAAAAAADATGALAPQDRAALHYRAGVAHYRDMDVRPCLEHYDRAAEAFRESGDLAGLGEVLAEKTRAQLTQAAVSYGAEIDVKPLERTLAELGTEHQKLRGRILARLSQVRWNARETSKAEALAQEALAEGRRLDDDQLCIEALQALALAQMQSLHVRDALESYRSALCRCQKFDDPWAQGWPLARIPMTLFWLGQLDEVEPIARRACQTTLRTQDWAEHSLALAALTMRAVASGDLPAAEEHARTCMAMLDRCGYPWGVAVMLPALACGRAQHGRLDEARDALDLLLEPGRVFAEPGPLMQLLVEVYRGLLRTPARVLERGEGERIENLVSAVETVGADAGTLAPLCALGEISDHHQLQHLAPALCEILDHAVEQGVVFTFGWVFLVPRVLALCHSLAGRWEQAETHFEDAIVLSTKAGAKPELGRTCLDYARVLARRGGASNRARAAQLVTRADAIFHQLDMEPRAWQAAEVAEAVGATVSAPGLREDHPDRLTSREVEIVRRLARGEGEGEIAAELLLSPATVSAYVGDIHDKTGAEGQEAVAAYAFEAGLLAASARARAAEPGPGAQPASHRPIVILMSDMVEFTRAVRRLGDEKGRTLIHAHNSILRAELRKYGGTDLQHTGDGILASFTSASRGIDAAIAIQRALAAHSAAHPEAGIRVRIGLHAGEPLPEEDRLFGAAVIAASRICDRGKADQIVVSDVVRALAGGGDYQFKDLGRRVLKGFSERFHLYEVGWREEEI